jgi:hypothetical protein
MAWGTDPTQVLDAKFLDENCHNDQQGAQILRLPTKFIMASKCKIRFSTPAVYGSAGGDQIPRPRVPHARMPQLATHWQVSPHVMHKFTYIRARTSYTRRVAIMYSPPCCRWSPCRVISFRSRTSYRRATRSRRAVERPGAIRSRSNGCVAPEPDKASPQQRNTPIPIPIPPPHPPWAVARVAVAAAAGRQRPPGGERSPARAPRPPPRSNRPDLGPSGPPPPWRGDCRCGQRCSSPSSSPALVPPPPHPRPTMSARCLLSWNPFLVLETRARRWILATRSASWR